MHRQVSGKKQAARTAFPMNLTTIARAGKHNHGSKSPPFSGRQDRMRLHPHKDF
jgi:hypothetical protein